MTSIFIVAEPTRARATIAARQRAEAIRRRRRAVRARTAVLVAVPALVLALAGLALADLRSGAAVDEPVAGPGTPAGSAPAGPPPPAVPPASGADAVAVPPESTATRPDAAALSPTTTAAVAFVAQLPPERLARWDRLAHCESRGTWDIATGNGYFGGLQFSLESWRGVGGTGRPDQASWQEQVMRAERLHQLQGWEAWPGCARHLGWLPG